MNLLNELFELNLVINICKYSYIHTYCIYIYINMLFNNSSSYTDPCTVLCDVILNTKYLFKDKFICINIYIHTRIYTCIYKILVGILIFYVCVLYCN